MSFDKEIEEIVRNKCATNPEISTPLHLLHRNADEISAEVVINEEPNVGENMNILMKILKRKAMMLIVLRTCDSRRRSRSICRF